MTSHTKQKMVPRLTQVTTNFLVICEIVIMLSELEIKS